MIRDDIRDDKAVVGVVTASERSKLKGQSMCQQRTVKQHRCDWGFAFPLL